MQTFITEDYEMQPGDTVLSVDPGQPFIEVKLPYVGEATGKFYAISNLCSSGNTVHVIDHGDSLNFESPTDMAAGTAYIYFSNGVQWHLVYSNALI